MLPVLIGEDHVQVFKNGGWRRFLWSTVGHSDYSSTSLGLFCFKGLELPWEQSLVILQKDTFRVHS